MAEVALAVEDLGLRLRNVLEDGLSKVGIRAEVETEPVRTTRLHRAMVISPHFEHLSHLERQEVVWNILRRSLSTEEQLCVSVVLAMTPGEVNGEE
jgi:hypothetical protein